MLTRPPVDSELLRDADRFKMDLVGGLERTLQGQVKPSMISKTFHTLLKLTINSVITQCSMRHLYAAASEPGVSYLIDKAKTYERRRCGHLPSDYPEPLSTSTCLSSVVDPKNNSTNKHRYVVASQDMETRKKMREILGVPLVYINRSVMIMEPMADKSVDNREREERGKFRAGLKRGAGRDAGQGGMKRKREEGSEDEKEEEVKKKKRIARGPKGPNPLAVKKAKKKPEEEKSATAAKSNDQKQPRAAVDENNIAAVEGGEEESSTKKRRKRKHKPSAITGNSDHATIDHLGDGDDSG